MKLGADRDDEECLDEVDEEELAEPYGSWLEEDELEYLRSNEKSTALLILNCRSS